MIKTILVLAAMTALGGGAYVWANRGGNTTEGKEAKMKESAECCKVGDENATCGTEHWKALSEEELRKKLTPEQYTIARQAGTERAFTGKYWDEHRPGIYQCAVCSQELFDAQTKFNSGTGWPSFYAPLKKEAVAEISDSTHGMVRVEVRCSRCQSHLGHVFDDGPVPTGKRYCMNSAVLDLKVDEKKAEEKKTK